MGEPISVSVQAITLANNSFQHANLITVIFQYWRLVPYEKHIVTCQRDGVSNKPPRAPGSDKTPILSIEPLFSMVDGLVPILPT